MREEIGFKISKGGEGVTS